MSELDLGAELDHLVGRDAEEESRIAAQAREHHEQTLAQSGHPLRAVYEQGLSPQEEARVVRIDKERRASVRGLRPTVHERDDLHHIRLIARGEAVTSDDPPEALPQIFHLQALIIGDGRRMRDLHRQEHDQVMHDHVVLQIVQECRWNARAIGRQVDRGALHSVWLYPTHVIEERAYLHEPPTDLAPQQLPPFFLGLHDEEEEGAEADGDVGASHELHGVRGHEGEIDEDEGQEHSQRLPPCPVPHTLRERDHPERGREHDQGDGHTVGRREIVRRALPDHEEQTHAEERHVHRRHVDLPRVMIRGGNNLHAREIPLVHRRAADAVGAGDECLRGDARRPDCKHHHGREPHIPARHDREEDVVLRDRSGVEQARRLPEIVTHQTGPDH